MRESCSWDVPDDSEFDDLRELMEDSPVADNYGRKRVDLVGNLEEGDCTSDASQPSHQRRNVFESLADAEVQMEGNDYQFKIPPGDESYHGLVAHRGVLSERESELLDWDKVDRLVTESLGVSVAEMDRLYSSAAGRPTKELASARSVIDARLLQIQEAGGNMSVLSACLGWPLDSDGKCWKMRQALSRARKAQ